MRPAEPTAEPTPRRPLGERVRALPAWAPVALLGALTLLAFVLRLAGLHATLTGDELYAYDDVHGRSLASMLSYIGSNQESSPPLFFVLAWAAAHVGDPTETIRLPSIVLGSALVPLVYLLARRAAGAPAALLAATLAAVNPFSIWQGAEARPYAVLMVCSVASALLLLRALDAPERRWRWVAYAVSVAAVVYTHYTGVFVLGAQTLWALLAHRDCRRQILAASAGAVVLYLPWLPSYHGSYLAVYNLFGVPLVPDRIAYTLVQPLIGHQEYSSLAAFPGVVPALGLLAVFALVAVIGARRASVAWRGGARPRSSLVLVLLLAAAAPAGVLAYASVSYDILLVRNLSSSVPFALVALAWLATALWQRQPLLTAVAALLAVTVMAIGAVRMLSPGASRARFRQALAFVNRREGAGDAILDESLFPLTGYYARYVPAYFARPGSVLTPGSPQAAAAWARARAGGRVFVLVERIGWLSRYRPPAFDGAQPRCRLAPAASEAPAGCVALRSTRSYPGLQPLVVSVYSGR